MRLITDFHLHSKWSRACSKDLTLPNIAKACERKGIGFVGTSDALHPAWRKSIGLELEEIGEGAFRLKDGSSSTAFLLSTEISCIYKRADNVRRVHHLILFPSLEALDRLTVALEARGANLKSDGRPIVGIDSEELLKMTLEADPACLLIPAHAWTPWFSVFGSKSGFNALEECFGDLTKHIYAIETGLSSDPAMNWRLSMLDRVFLVSNSDAHSCENLGREANVFDMERPSYDELRRILVEHDTSKFIETIEFFPEEGKYHADGHRECAFWCAPEETKRLKGICPKCGRPLTVGVLYRVAELADRLPHPARPPRAVPFRSIIPLRELVADAFDVGKTSKKVQQAVGALLSDGRSEFGVLLDLPASELGRVTSPEVVNLGLNVTMKYPAGHIVTVNDQTALTIERPTDGIPESDARWFSLTPYDERRETELLSAFATSTPVSYFVDGRILMGRRGMLLSDQQPIVVLRVRGGGTTSHLLWAKDPLGRADGSALKTVLATMDFDD